MAQEDMNGVICFDPNCQHFQNYQIHKSCLWYSVIRKCRQILSNINFCNDILAQNQVTGQLVRHSEEKVLRFLDKYQPIYQFLKQIEEKRIDNKSKSEKRINIIKLIQNHKDFMPKLATLVDNIQQSCSQQQPQQRCQYPSSERHNIYKQQKDIQSNQNKVKQQSVPKQTCSKQRSRQKRFTSKSTIAKSINNIKSKIPLFKQKHRSFSQQQYNN